MIQLETERLLLRRLELPDAPAVQQLAGEYEIALNTLNIPHPYPNDLAEEWIQRTHDLIENRTGFPFAITQKEKGIFMGAIGIHPEADHHKAEIGYWLGKAFRNRGYATEAVKRVIQFGFEELELNRIQASYFTSNPASRKVMEKAGMIYEGTLRQAIFKWDEFKDLGYCAILREEYETRGITRKNA